ncbi:4'-phosphopantetheinyl transferase superfamily protein [Paenibacillaceae bacterium]|nr:4'-phosphopantetheinyl transferase superfamily protein [Paenibacillaceae bacterium]
MDIFAVNIMDMISEPLSYWDKTMKLVSAQKAEKLSRYRLKEDFVRSLLGELLLRVQLARLLQLPNHEIVFDANLYGKPYLIGHPLEFNISHAGNWVVCALSHTVVGIDIEEIKAMDIGIAERFYAKKEYADLLAKAAEERQTYFYELWTLKESYIKAIGLGLSLPLDTFSFQITGNDIVVEDSQPRAKFFFRQYPVNSKYKLAVCHGINYFPAALTILPAQQVCREAIQLLP